MVPEQACDMVLSLEVYSSGSSECCWGQDRTLGFGLVPREQEISYLGGSLDRTLSSVHKFDPIFADYLVDTDQPSDWSLSDCDGQKRTFGSQRLNEAASVRFNSVEGHLMQRIRCQGQARNTTFLVPLENHQETTHLRQSLCLEHIDCPCLQ